ncbi:MAG: hypothetical protein FVQ83_10445 [Chloroflexi bacterium]|nr:hypothetical protein [Chloroflexota bacterium]
MNWSEFFYNLYNSQWFFPVLVFWLFIGVIYGSKRNSLIQRLREIFSKPIILDEDNDPDKDKLPFYPRTFLERITQGFRDTLTKPFDNGIKGFRNFIQGQHKSLYDEEKPLRTFGYLFFLVCVVIFAIADTIAIANRLSIMGLLIYPLTPFLLNYGFAVGAATLLSVIIGFLIISQVFSKKSDFTHFDEISGPFRGIVIAFSTIIIFIGLAVAFLMGWQSLITLGTIEGSETANFLIGLGANVLILINGILSAAIIFGEALRGLFLIIIAFEWVIYLIFYIANCFVTILGSLIPFLIFDVAYRLLYIIIDILQYIVFTPVLAVLAVFKWFSEWIQTASKDTANGNSE